MSERLTLPRLLITSVGSLVGQNLLEGLAPRRERCAVIGLNSQADAVSNFLCDRVHLVPELAAGEDYEARFTDLVRRERPDLILPGRDDDVVFLAAWAERHGDRRCMVGSAASAQALRDKRATADAMARFALPFAPTLCGQDGLDAALDLARAWGWPLVAKPRRGNASRGVVLVTNAQELQAALAWPGYCLQPWLGPPPDLRAWAHARQGGIPLDWSLPGIEKVSLDGCIDPTGALVAPFATRHAEVRLGRSERVEALALDAGLDRLLRGWGSALARLGWRGPFNVQLGRQPDQTLMAFEVNGRFTGSAATLSWLGHDYIGQCLDAFLGGGTLAMVTPVRVGRVDKRLGNWALDPAALAALRQQGFWER